MEAKRVEVLSYHNNTCGNVQRLSSDIFTWILASVLLVLSHNNNILKKCEKTTISNLKIHFIEWIKI